MTRGGWESDAMEFKTWSLSALGVLLVLTVAAALYALGVAPSHLAVSAPFLLVVVLIAAVWGRGAAVVAALASAPVFNYLIVPPPYSFSTPTPDEGFFVISLIAAALIVGGWKERTLRVEHQMRQLATSEKLQKVLLDTISHDFKTPLTSIVGCLNSLLFEGRRLNELDRKELIETAYQQATRLNRLVTDVLEMTRLEAGTVRLRREPASIGEVIRQALSHARETMSERRPSIDIPRDLPPVAIDAVLMSHALANVLENAAKYSAPDSPIEVQAQAANGHVIIAVCDRGIGVPAEDLGRIFEKFYRRDEVNGFSWAACGSGTGLGLAIAKGIVEAHGGRIWAEQRAQGGVIVRLHLPLERP
jgi:two-component system, OmpR family, sensor histidine kinase KdpD